MNSQHDRGSHLFLVRLWSEEMEKLGELGEVGDQKGWEWRGRVQHVLSGEAHTFHDWPTLIRLLLEMAETDGIEARAQGGGAAALPDAAP
jgi:hypothetical protein